MHLSRNDHAVARITSPKKDICVCCFFVNRTITTCRTHMLVRMILCLNAIANLKSRQSAAANLLHIHMRTFKVLRRTIINTYKNHL